MPARTAGADMLEVARELQRLHQASLLSEGVDFAESSEAMGRCEELLRRHGGKLAEAFIELAREKAEADRRANENACDHCGRELGQ